MSSKRCFLATTVLQDRWTGSLLSSSPCRLVALGGYNGHTRLDTAEIYDPGASSSTNLSSFLPAATNQWDPLPSMAQARSDFAAVTFQGKVYAIGGFDGINVLRSIESYDPEEKQWMLCTNMVTERSGVR